MNIRNVCRNADSLARKFTRTDKMFRYTPRGKVVLKDIFKNSLNSLIYCNLNIICNEGKPEKSEPKHPE